VFSWSSDFVSTVSVRSSDFVSILGFTICCTVANLQTLVARQSTFVFLDEAGNSHCEAGNSHCVELSVLKVVPTSF
jgi:hypothetical protein